MKNNKRVGDVIKVIVLRNGKEIDISVKLKAMSEAMKLLNEVMQIYENAKKVTDYYSAIEKLKKAGEIYKKEGEGVNEAKCYYTIGYLYVDLTEFDQALEIVPSTVEIRDGLLVDYSIKKLKSQEIFEKFLRFF